jgi:holo-[acyl-carrier protein] synthase
MILGTGSDVTDISRIEQALARFGQRFEDRVFTPGEQRKAQSRSNAGSRTVAATYAKRFAAKEACAKALGTGLRAGVFWRDMEVVNLPSGQPTLELTGGALARLCHLLPPGHRAAIHLTLTDDYPTAQAHIIIEAIPL